MRLRATSLNILSQSTEVVDLVSIIYGITNSGSAFNLRSSGTVNYTIDWGDGSAEQTSTSNNLAHTFTAGDYTLRLNTDVAYRPFFNDISADIDQIVSTIISNDTDLGTNLENAWSGANNMITFSCLSQSTVNVSNFNNAWLNCSSLTSFPSIATANATTFINAWKNNTSLIVFPQSVFNSTGTLTSNAFEGAFNNCALDAQSLGYILISLDQNGASNIVLDINGGTNADISTISDSAIDAYKNLRSKSWNISHNGSYNDIIYTINSTGGVFNLRSTGTVDYDATWGDGSTDPGSTNNTLSHTYAAGTHSLGIYSFIPYRPFFNNSGDEDQITSTVISTRANLGTDLSFAWKGANNMTSFVCPSSRTANVTSFNSAWYGCSGLTSFPLIDASNSTNLVSAWQDCSGLTSFPSINTSSCTDLNNTWNNCSSLTEFPSINTSSCTDLNNTWNNCSSLTAFPILNTVQCLNFTSTWKGCSGITLFPTIDTSNGTNLTSSWEGCSNLTSFPALTTSSATTLFKSWNGCSSLITFPTINTSNSTTVKQAWLNCSALTTFPSLNLSSCTDFESAWQNCTSLSTYPADVFNNTGSLVSTAFSNSWDNCALNSQSIENILKSLDVNGSSNIDLTISGGTNANASTWSSISRIAYFNLSLKNWNIAINGTVTAADITYTIANTGSVFNLRSAGAVDYVIGWGDGTSVESSTSNLAAHTYSSGNYSINIETNAAYRPYFNDVSTDVDQITTVSIRSGATLGTSLQNAWKGANNMTSFVCDATTTTGVTNFSYSWCNCSSLTSFPAVDTSNGLDFSYAWENCSGLTIFPTLTTTSGTNFAYAWFSCSSLTAFPTLTYTNATNFSYAWNSCTNLATFPSGVFNTTGTLASNAFSYCWTGCALTAQSIENILTSLDTNGQSNIYLDLNGGTNADASTWSTAAKTAYDNLVVKGWTITKNGTFATYEITYTISNTGTTFELRDAGTVSYDVDWGDGSTVETVTTNNKSHTYASAGTYTVKLDTTGSYRPSYNSNANGDQITAITIDDTAVLNSDIQSAFRHSNNMTSFSCGAGTAGVNIFGRTWYDCSALTSFPLINLSASNISLFAAWSGCSGLTSFPLLNTSNVNNVEYAWRSLSSLTSFPALDLSSCTSFSHTWYRCSSLTSFPLIDTTNSTKFSSTWMGCQALTSFPSLNLSSGTNFQQTWRECMSLASFPSLNLSSGTFFQMAWRECTSLTAFPANMFDSTGTLASNAFDRSWYQCALTAQSIENILTSLDTNGASGITLGIDGGTNADASTWSTAAITAYNNLIGKGWTITQNGTVPVNEIVYTITNSGTTFELRDSGTVNYVVDWGDGSATETVTTNNKSHTYASAGTYTVKLDTTGSYYPHYHGNANGDQITSVTIDATADLGTTISRAFRDCNNMTSFVCPSAVTSGIQFMSNTWQDCDLTSFPLLNTSTCRNFPTAWRNNSSLTTFPANMFDSTGTLISAAFANSWKNCALTAQSIENILTSLDTNGASGITLGIESGTNAAYSTWSTAAQTALTNLITKGWTVTYNT